MKLLKQLFRSDKTIDQLNSPTQQLGGHFERKAESILVEKGLKTIKRNYDCKMGEIDLVMKDKSCLVFVEVRYRKNTQFGSAAESVTINKQKKLIRTAKYFLIENKRYENFNCRFDIVAFDNHKYHWVQNAFQVE